MLDFEIGENGAKKPVSPQTQYDPNHPKIKRVEVYWHTVTYKTVALYVVLIAVILVAALYLLNPNIYTEAYDRFAKSITSDSDAPAITQTQARFVNLDGKVQVKKVNSVNWVDADFHTTLDKGDQIQTSSDGAARITFADGTTYTVKSELLSRWKKIRWGAKNHPVRECASAPAKSTCVRQISPRRIRKLRLASRTRQPRCTRTAMRT